MPGAGRVRLAANFSPALRGLVTVRPELVDAVKVSEFDRPEYLEAYAQLRSRKPLILHGLGCPARPGEPSFARDFAPQALRGALACTDSDYVSVHLERIVELGERFDPQRFLTRLVLDVAAIRDAAALPVCLENAPFYRTLSGRPANHPLTCDPSFIGEALAATRCELILDLAHAGVAAWHRGEPATDYVTRLPLGLVREIHVSGPALVDGELRDRHGPVSEAGYALLREVLGLAPARTVTLEYGGLGPLFEGRSDPSILEAQLRRLRRIMRPAGADSTPEGAQLRKPPSGSEARPPE